MVCIGRLKGSTLTQLLVDTAEQHIGHVSFNCLSSNNFNNKICLNKKIIIIIIITNI